MSGADGPAAPGAGRLPGPAARLQLVAPRSRIVDRPPQVR